MYVHMYSFEQCSLHIDAELYQVLMRDSYDFVLIMTLGLFAADPMQYE